jgi:16S rRNA processing protein RimM
VPGRPRVAGSRRSDRPEPAPSPEGRGPAPAVPELVVVGRVGRPQGIKGEVTVEVRTDDPDDRFAVGRVLTTEPVERGPLTVESSRQQGKYLVVLFEGVADRNTAELLRDTLVLVDVADLPPLAADDEYYDTQLIGLSAELADGSSLGEVTDVLHLPGGDVLVVRRSHGAEALVPFVRAIVPTVDLPGGRVVIHPPAGLLDLSDPVPED